MKKRGEIHSIKEYKKKVADLKKPLSKYCLYLFDEYTLTKEGFKFRLLNLEDSLNFRVLRRYDVDLGTLTEMAESFEDYSWAAVARYQKLDWRFIADFEDELNFQALCRYQNFEMETLLTYEDQIDWEVIAQYQNLTPEIMDRFANRLNWKILSKNQRLTEELIEKYEDRISWFNISLNQKLSIEFVNKYKDKIRPGILYDNFVIRKKVKRKLIRMRVLWFSRTRHARYKWRN